MRQDSLHQLVKAFSTKRVLVVGDAMLDEYLMGSVERISPEAPIPIVSLASRDVRLGGAANVALNILGLRAQVDIVALRGADDAGHTLQDLLGSKGIDTSGLVESPHRRTTRKARVLSRGQQLLRVDTEDAQAPSEREEELILAAVQTKLSRQAYDVILFEDYDKGALSPRIIEQVTRWAKSNGALTVVDPKLRNFACYRSVDLFKPNRAELTQGLGTTIAAPWPQSIERAHQLLHSKLSHARTLVTLGPDGAAIATGVEAAYHAPSLANSVVDVCGAGDSVAAVVALGLACGASDRDLINLANLAGAAACARVGVHPLNEDMLLGSIA